jgi:hypothetical protein
VCVCVCLWQHSRAAEFDDVYVVQFEPFVVGMSLYCLCESRFARHFGKARRSGTLSSHVCVCVCVTPSGRLDRWRGRASGHAKSVAPAMEKIAVPAWPAQPARGRTNFANCVATGSIGQNAHTCCYDQLIRRRPPTNVFARLPPPHHTQT